MNVINFLLWQPVDNLYVRGIGIALVALFIQRFPGQVLSFDNINSFADVPSFADLKTTSTAVQNLNGNTADAAIPRANLYGSIPHRNAALRVLYSSLNDDAGFEGAVRKRNQAVSMFKTCRAIGYATIVMWNSGRRCGWARRVIGRIDERWVKYVNGSDQFGNARIIPFDGIVPNERSRYPSPNALAYDAPIIGANHQNIYKTRVGLDEVANAMRAIDMEPAGTPPGSPPISSVSIDGPTEIQQGAVCTWSVSVGGGTPPYSYQWTNDGQNGGNDYWYSGSRDAGSGSSSFRVKVWVTDAAGQQGNHEIIVSETSAPVCFQ